MVVVGGGVAGLFAVRSPGRAAVVLFTAVVTWLVAFSRGVRRERAFITQPVDTRDVYRRTDDDGR